MIVIGFYLDCQCVNSDTRRVAECGDWGQIWGARSALERAAIRAATMRPRLCDCEAPTPMMLDIFEGRSMQFTTTARLAAWLLAAAVLPLTLAGCGQSQQSGGPPPPTVTVANPVQRTVVDQD